MAFRDIVLGQPSPRSLDTFTLPRRVPCFPSPADWRDEVLYFLLPDRFSDGREASRPAARPRQSAGAARPPTFRFDRWAQGGGERWQGGTLRGITSKLDYLRRLGMTCLWVGPGLQAAGPSRHLSRLRDPGLPRGRPALRDAAGPRRPGRRGSCPGAAGDSRHHLQSLGTQLGLRRRARTRRSDPGPGSIREGPWIDASGRRDRRPSVEPTTASAQSSSRPTSYYTRAGKGSLGAGGHRRPERRAQADRLRRQLPRLQLRRRRSAQRRRALLQVLDRADRLRRLPARHPQARVRGAGTQLLRRDQGVRCRTWARRTSSWSAKWPGLTTTPSATATCSGATSTRRSISARSRRILHARRKGIRAARRLLRPAWPAWDPIFGSHRNAGEHARVDPRRPRPRVRRQGPLLERRRLRPPGRGRGGDPALHAGHSLRLLRDRAGASPGPEKDLRDQFLPDYNVGNPPPDKYLREAMFGPEHPRLGGRAGLAAGPAGVDDTLPGFGPFGTTGHHCFDDGSPAYLRIAALAAVRKAFPVCATDDSISAQISNFGAAFALPSGWRAHRLVAHPRRRGGALRRQRARPPGARRSGPGRRESQRRAGRLLRGRRELGPGGVGELCRDAPRRRAHSRPVSGRHGVRQDR